MRARRTLSLIASAALIGALLPAAATGSGSRSHVTKTTFRYFFKATSESFTTPSKKRVSRNRAPAAGDILFVTDHMYRGTVAHHASKVSGTSFLYCIVIKASKSRAEANCDAVAAIGGSMLISQSTQNLYATSTVYPIVAGTGRFLHARGRVKVRNVNNKGTKSEGVFTIF